MAYSSILYHQMFYIFCELILMSEHSGGWNLAAAIVAITVITTNTGASPLDDFFVVFKL